MKKDFRGTLTEFAAKKNWSIPDLALKLEVPTSQLHDCFKSDVWPKEIESKIMEMYVDELGKNPTSFKH